MNHIPPAKDLFLQALEFKTAEERARFLARVCADNDALRRRVDALLAAHDDPESYLERPAARFDVTATTDGTGRDSGLSDSSPSHHGRFLPGTKVASRYRIVSMLGRGGMGEVYRADDLRLGQTVALKFLPPELAKDAKRLEYFHNEVKLARQISHPNVCRVYDIGEVDGQHFISMEYIDGEDLKTLLHRIGRLPKDKGIQIAQQLCSGIAAAHSNGVLHRDLKPANIMIDGQGQARITDFGLAAISKDGANVIGMSGTPAYMAPEQLLRGETSIQSDLYSFGLILYEAVAGKPAHAATSLAELRQMHDESSTFRKPSSISDDVDPVLERAICRCLEPSPEDRPKSAIELSASFPGGNPLAAALLAGELPSPALLAASGESGTISKTAGGMLLAVLFAGIVTAYFLADHVLQVNQLTSPRPPEFLRYRGLEIIDHLGYSDAIGGVATGFDELKSSHYWVRTTPWSFDNAISSDGLILTRVHYSETPWNVDGMVGVRMNHIGQLTEFRAEPRKYVRTTPTKTIPKWEEWFSQEQLGFSLASLTESNWQIAPPVVFDQLQSWEGTLPDGNGQIYIQAAAFQGRPVHFALMDSKAFELTLQDQLAVRGDPPGWAYVLVLDLALIIVLGTRNLYLGRGDRSGATKIMIVFGVLALVIWVLNGQHEFDLAEELQGFQSWLGIPAYFAAAIWLRYVALEPTIRRISPDLLISWSRLLKGRFLNPIVHRDILIGLSAGAIAVVSDLAASYWTGESRTLWNDCEALNSNSNAIGVWIHESTVFMTWAFIWTFLIAVLYPVVRSRVLGSLIFFVVSLAMAIAEGSSLDLLMFGAFRTIILLAVIQRFGLLALMAMGIMDPLMRGIPLTTDTSAFFFQRGLLPTVLVVAIACFCFVVSTSPNRQAGRRYG